MGLELGLGLGLELGLGSAINGEVPFGMAQCVADVIGRMKVLMFMVRFYFFTSFYG